MIIPEQVTVFIKSVNMAYGRNLKEEIISLEVIRWLITRGSHTSPLSYTSNFHQKKTKKPTELLSIKLHLL